MPLYEFHCEKCDYVFEQLLDTRKVLAMECPKCKELAEKIISSSNFVVNGYNTQNNYSKGEAK